MDDLGYIKTNMLMETSVPGVYAAGEAADPNFRQVVTSAGMGAAAAMQAVKFLEKTRSIKASTEIKKREVKWPPAFLFTKHRIRVWGFQKVQGLAPPFPIQLKTRCALTAPAGSQTGVAAVFIGANLSYGQH